MSRFRLFSRARVLARCLSSNVAWRLGRLNHVAIAVPDLEKASALYRDVLGADVSQSVVRHVATFLTDSVTLCELFRSWISVCLFMRLSVCLLVCPFVCLSVYSSVRLSVYLSVRLSVCLLVCQFHLLKHKLYITFLTLNTSNLLSSALV